MRNIKIETLQVKMSSLRKKPRTCRDKSDYFDGLPDDLVVSILRQLGSSASSPSDFINAILTCKRMNQLGRCPLVLSKLGPKAFAIKAQNWSEYAHRFLKLCVHAGNIEAHYMLGMIRFYCLENRLSGASLMAKAAMKAHAPALYALAVIQFNGSGKSKSGKDLKAGVALCARAAFLGHIDALRELGHCLQDGYGVRQNIIEGRKLLIQANARELASIIRPNTSSTSSASSTTMTHVPSPRDPHRLLTWHCQNHESPDKCPFGSGSGCPILSDFGCNVPCPEPHPGNKFLVEWFGSGLGKLGHELSLCSNVYCGRPETRAHEFRRCSVCSSVNYCSRGCQALHWKSHHRDVCVPNQGLMAEGQNGNLDINGEMADQVEDGH